MNPKEIKENEIICLKQLRLSKWQLIWNRRHEITALKEIDEKSITSMELAGTTEDGKIKQLRDNTGMQVVSKQAEIEYAKREILILDTVIAGLEHDFAEFMHNGKTT